MRPILAIGMEAERHALEHLGAEILPAARQLGDRGHQLRVGRVLRQIP